MLQLRNLKVSYDGVLAVSKVNLDVRAGSIVALVGGNGNGKSTTLRAVAGLNAVDQGSIFFKGEDIARVPAHKRVGLGLSLVPEGRRIFARLTVERNLELVLIAGAIKKRLQSPSIPCTTFSQFLNSGAGNWRAQ